ncbi:MAG: UDP-N-acetylmuramoyl-L-alanine--D-glutamate ligase, partial [Pseudomonadales bacterium]|nr:UDP-N-acetylmuramoyl-L-alanine--D-glutamate ligase [Pseudomonadales bacterium]
PMLDLLNDDCDLYVLELSSFQLERAHHFNFAVACILNISADHMDRHKNLMHYHQLKQKVYSEAKLALFNREDQLTYPLLRTGLAQRSFGQRTSELNDYGLETVGGREFIVKGVQPVLAVDSIVLPGGHNVLNIMAALAIIDAAGINMQGLAERAAAFTGLPHRCELVATLNDVRYINDSKATNVGATVAALQGLAAGNDHKIVLIAGGQTKAADFAPLAERLVQQPCELVLIGEGAGDIAKACAGTVAIHHASDMRAAVDCAQALANAGDIVLLSPACASFDSYSGYAARGDAFRQAVLQLAESSQGVQP